MALIDSVAQHCADVRPGLVDDHFRRLPESYFDHYSVSQIAGHIGLLDALTPERFVLAQFNPLGPNSFEVLVVGLDQVGVLASISTLLMSEGFNVQDLHVATYLDEDGKPTFFIDTFRVSTKAPPSNLSETGERFGRRLQDIMLKVGQGQGIGVELLAASTQSAETHEQTVIRRDALEGQLLDGRFQLHARLAAGGMSVVYLADELGTGRRVAVKVLRHRDDASGDEMESRFIREARALASFTCPSIVKLLGTGVFDDPHYIRRHWMALEYLPGGDLASWVKQHGPAPVALALRWLKQCLEGLVYAHERGILHRDLKPHNLLLTDEGDVQITDFGLLKSTDQPAGEHTIHGTILGTPQYMPPEQALGETIDERSDIYSLGVTFYKIFSGRLPYEDESATAVFAKVVRHELPSLSTASPELSGPVSVVVNRMIARRRDERYQSVDVILQDLASFERRGVLQFATKGWSDPRPVSAAASVAPASQSVLRSPTR